LLRRLKLSLNRDPAVTITRVSIGKNKLVYVLVADKRLGYPLEKSSIVYIGTTKNGVSRVAQSVAARTEDILSNHGVRSFSARIVTCAPRQNVTTWKKLERAFLLAFREKFGDVPKCNVHGKGFKEKDEFSYFAKRGVLNVINNLG